MGLHGILGPYIHVGMRDVTVYYYVRYIESHLYNILHMEVWVHNWHNVHNVEMEHKRPLQHSPSLSTLGLVKYRTIYFIVDPKESKRFRIYLSVENRGSIPIYEEWDREGHPEVIRIYGTNKDHNLYTNVTTGKEQLLQFSENNFSNSRSQR